MTPIQVGFLCREVLEIVGLTKMLKNGLEMLIYGDFMHVAEFCWIPNLGACLLLIRMVNW